MAILILFSLEVLLAVMILMVLNFSKTEVIQSNRKGLAFGLFFMGTFNLLLALFFLYNDLITELFCSIFFALPWFWWFEKQTIAVKNNHLFNMYRRFSDEIVTDNKGIVELEPGEHYVPYPFFKIGSVEHEENDALEGFDTQNNILEVANFNTVTKDTQVVLLQEVEAELVLNKDDSYQFDFFSYKGIKGQNGVALFVLSQITDALKHFVSRYTTAQLDTPEKVRMLFEQNGEHSKMINDINHQIQEFKVNYRGEQQPLRAYSLKLIKIGQIKPSDLYLAAVEEKVLAGIYNQSKETRALGAQERADKLGISLDKLMILEEIVKGYNISGNHGGSVPFFNINSKDGK